MQAGDGKYAEAQTRAKKMGYSCAVFAVKGVMWAPMDQERKNTMMWETRVELSASAIHFDLTYRTIDVPCRLNERIIAESLIDSETQAHGRTTAVPLFWRSMSSGRHKNALATIQPSGGPNRVHSRFARLLR